jgi:hypothetical protein
MFVTPGAAGIYRRRMISAPARGWEVRSRPAVVWHQLLDQGPTGLRLYILGDVFMGLFSGEPFLPRSRESLKDPSTSINNV